MDFIDIFRMSIQRDSVNYEDPYIHEIILDYEYMYLYRR